MKVLNKMLPGKITSFPILVCFFILGITACKKSNVDKHDLRDFQQVNLVSNTSVYAPLTIDPTLHNAWGLAWSPNGIAWVNSLGGHVSELYSAEGAIIRPGVRIPSPADTIGGLPTGIVFSGGAGFKISNGQAANFLFAGVDGVISGWNGAAGNNALRIANVPGASFTGLALATRNGFHFIYAADFKNGKISVWDTTYTAVSLPFHDPGLPAGYAPFNIQLVGSWLFVTYAKPGPDGRAQAGYGLGLVDIFTTDGALVKRFASKGYLNAPWGVTMSPANFLNSMICRMMETMAIREMTITGMMLPILFSWSAILATEK